MGAEARRNAANRVECYTGADINVKIRPRNTRKARLAEEKKRRVLLPIPKGSTPMKAQEMKAIFDAARAVREDYRAGKIGPGMVELEVPVEGEEP